MPSIRLQPRPSKIAPNATDFDYEPSRPSFFFLLPVATLPALRHIMAQHSCRAALAHCYTAATESSVTPLPPLHVCSVAC